MLATAVVSFDEALGIINMMSSDVPVPPKVFVSYSHDSPEHKSRVRDLSDRLRREGIDSNLDQYEQSPPEGWPRWMERQIEEADFVLVVCTATYERRYRGAEDPGRGLGGSWEGAILTQHLYEAQANNASFIPVLFTPSDGAHIPFVLRGATHYRVDTEEGYIRLYRHLTAQPEVRRPGLGNRRVLPPLESDPGSATSREQAASEDKYSEAEQVIRSCCESQWPDDYTMRNYCISQQREAVDALKRGRPDDIPQGVFAGIRSKCAADWPEDYNMRLYCEKQQIDSYRDLARESG
jgi:hypothetical protein